jgi:translation initiation factor 2B subunit (eIF-2B alpha/beta/delta family)
MICGDTLYKMLRSSGVHLVTAHIKIKLKKTEARPNVQAHFDTQRLRDNTVKVTFISDLIRNRFQILQGISDAGKETSVNNT